MRGGPYLPKGPSADQSDAAGRNEIGGNEKWVTHNEGPVASSEHAYLCPYIRAPAVINPAVVKCCAVGTAVAAASLATIATVGGRPVVRGDHTRDALKRRVILAGDHLEHRFRRVGRELA